MSNNQSPFLGDTSFFKSTTVGENGLLKSRKVWVKPHTAKGHTVKGHYKTESRTKHEEEKKDRIIKDEIDLAVHSKEEAQKIAKDANLRLTSFIPNGPASGWPIVRLVGKEKDWKKFMWNYFDKHKDSYNEWLKNKKIKNDEELKENKDSSGDAPGIKEAADTAWRMNYGQGDEPEPKKKLKFVKKESQVDYFVDKFKTKMGKDVEYSTMAGWVDGIGELTNDENKKLKKKLAAYINKGDFSNNGK